MPRINPFGVGMLSKSPYVTSNGMRNMYCERRPQGEKASMVAYRTPGLVEFTDFLSSTPPRGGYECQTTNSAFVVVSNTLYEVNGSGAFTSRGTLNTFAGRVSMADNGVQVMIVDGTNGYIYNTQTTVFAQITDVDFPASPLTVAFLSRRFAVNPSGQRGRFYWSDIDDGLSWDALNFTNAEASPDPLVALWANNGQFIALGSVTTQYYGDSGAVDSAFSEIKGTATEWGLAATWSVAKFDNSIAMLVKNRMGQVMIAQLSGYLPKKISTPDVDAIINGYSIVSDASAYSYMLSGHAMYVINFPSANAGGGATWLYDSSTSIWTQLDSMGLTRHLAEFGWSFLTYTIVADYSDSKLYQLTDTALDDSGSQIEAVIVSETVTSPDLERFTAEKMRVDIEVGQGSVSVPSPQIGLSISRDNGNTWGAEMMRDIGPLGSYSTTVEWTRLGTSRQFTFKLRVTDPFAFTLVNAILNPDD